MVITSLQLLQMVVGCVVNYTAFTFKTKGQSLSHPSENFLTEVGCSEESLVVAILFIHSSTSWMLYVIDIRNVLWSE